MEHRQVAKDVVAALGGTDNINAAAHCATRLRMVVADTKAIDQAALDAHPDIKGTFEAGGQFQIIIGPGDVDKVYDELVAATGVRSVSKDEAKQIAGQGANPFVRFIKTLADIFVPILPALIAGGLLMALHNVLASQGLFGPQSVIEMFPALADATDLINMLAAAAFAFLPILVAFSAAIRFGANPYVGAALGAAMVMPQLVNGYAVAQAMAEGTMTFWNIFGLQVAQAGYQGTVIPVLAVVYLLSVVEKLLHRWLKGTFDFLFTPMIALLVTGLATFIAVGPLMRLVSDGITFGLEWVYNSFGFLGGAVFGFVYSPIVVTGLHQSFPAVELSLIAQGGSFIFAIASMANIAQGAACLAIFLLVRRGGKLRAMAGASSLSALLGITEPAIFGVNLRLQFPFFIGMGSAAVAGAFISIFNVKAVALGAAGVIGFVSIKAESIPLFFVCAAISFTLSFTATLLYARWRVSRGLELEPSPAGEAAEAAAEAAAESIAAGLTERAAFVPVEIAAPAQGTIIPLGEVADAMFAGGMLGPGGAVEPTSGDVVAPVAGVVTAVFPTGHAYGITTDEGVELLIHIGLDTVSLGGRHFTPRVTTGARVAVGDALASVDWDAVAAEGFATTTVVVVTNADALGVDAIAADEHTPVAAGAPMFRVDLAGAAAAAE